MREKFSRRDLPHWDYPGATYFVTTCLQGSIPATGMVEIIRLRQSLERISKPPQQSISDWKSHCWKQVFVESERWLDQDPAVRFLADERLAGQVQATLQYFAGERYELLAWVIMPSHYHWVYRPRDEWVRQLGSDADQRSPRQRIQHSVNRHSAVICNELLGQTGDFWQREFYDHCIRDAEELERIINYIHANPVKAGIAGKADDYRFSSAFVGHVSNVTKPES